MLSDPVALLGLMVVAGLYARGRASLGSAPSRARTLAFAVGLVAIGVAVCSPLEEAARRLLSLHMIQHVLLLSIAAPALAWSRPLTVIVRGLPSRSRLALARGRGVGRLTPRRTRAIWRLVPAALGYVAVLWVWHAAALYEAARGSVALHILEHVTFLGAGLLFWGVVVGAHGARPIDRGQALLAVFATSIPTVFLAALMTFATQPWYPAYARATRTLGLDPLADQRLAGALMWIPMGLVHTGAILLLVAAWLRAAEQQMSPREPALAERT